MLRITGDPDPVDRGALPLVSAAAWTRDGTESMKVRRSSIEQVCARRMRLGTAADISGAAADGLRSCGYSA